MKQKVTSQMKFYNRIEELKDLGKLEDRSQKTGVMTALTGRRRVGKTLLALEHMQGKKYLYLFVGRKEEHILCQEFMEEIIKLFPLPIAIELKYFKDIFALLLDFAKREHVTVIFDEFQEFFQINPSVYSDIQKLWDLNRYDIKMHVIFIGSIYSLMHKIFEDEKQPLFGRADAIFKIKPFSLKTMKEILADNNILNSHNFFNFYVLTGSVPKYLDALLREGVKNKEEMLNVIIAKNSIFLNEGKNLLIEELGREYITYFSILELIAQGKTSRGEIESLLEKDIGGYLQRLESDYNVIWRHRPINAKIQSRNQKYKIVDNFLNFWFRFIYRFQSAIEIENFNYIKKIVERDYSTYIGPILERFFQGLLAETGAFNQIGSYWEQDNKNEIDVVAINDLEKIIVVAETKLNKARINIKALEEKAQSLLKTYEGYRPIFLSLGIEDALNIDEMVSSKIG